MGAAHSVIVLPYLQETRMILRSVVSALGIVVLTGSFAAAQAPAARRPARGRRSAGAHEKPASSPERHAAAAGRRDHARLQRGAGRASAVTAMCGRSPATRATTWRPTPRSEKTGRARHDADDQRDQHEARRQHQEAGRSDCARGVRDLPSRRDDSRDAAAAPSACCGTGCRPPAK